MWHITCSNQMEGAYSFRLIHYLQTTETYICIKQAVDNFYICWGGGGAQYSIGLIVIESNSYLIFVSL